MFVLFVFFLFVFLLCLNLGGMLGCGSFEVAVFLPICVRIRPGTEGQNIHGVRASNLVSWFFVLERSPPSFFLLAAAWVCPERIAPQSAKQRCYRRNGHNQS